jgi:hypothetical protein
MPTRRHTAAFTSRLALLLGLLAMAGCASRSQHVEPLPANPADFASWDCPRIDDELDRVQQRAADVAYAVDERVGNNILALGVGLTVFWPAILALRPDGLEAAELGRLKGRYEALRVASHKHGCPPAGELLSAAVAAALPVAPGDRLHYEDRSDRRRGAEPWVLRVAQLRRGEIEFAVEPEGARWLQDRSGNVITAPLGALAWPRLLRGELALGQLVAGELRVVGDPLARARLRGQVMAVGPQTVIDRRFDVAVIELFGDAQRGDNTTRVEGSLVVDRASGVLLRLDLKSSQSPFTLQRRLMRIESPGPTPPMAAPEAPPAQR